QEHDFIRRTARPHEREAGAAATFASEYLELEEQYVLEGIDLETFRARRMELQSRHLRNPSGAAGTMQQQEEGARRRRESNVARREQDIRDVWPNYEKR